MALGEFCAFFGLLALMTLLFPLLEIIIIILSPQLYIKRVTPIRQKTSGKPRDNPYSRVGDLKNTRRYTEENCFADAILWADVGNDL